jgi:pyroglutamyl-peptidase
VRPVLITGFVPYGGHSRNPAAEIAAALDGRTIAGVPIVGRQLPVSLARIAGLLGNLLEDCDPCAVVALGLAPGEPVIRLERVGVNVADFDGPDNDGRLARDEPLVEDGPGALFSTLPLREIEEALLAAGVPARISDSAGTYLCNACLFHLLHAARTMPQPPRCGFVHLPHLPEQVADRLRQGKSDGLASMDLANLTKAIEIVVATTLQASPQ